MPPINGDTPTVNSVWAQRGQELTDVEFLTLPSGQTCKARRMGIEGMVIAGLLSESDDLLSLVGDEHLKKTPQMRGHLKKGEEAKPEVQVDAMSLIKDPQALGRILMLVDRALPMLVVEPAVERHFEDVVEDGVATTRMIPQEERLPGVVYTDWIDLLDKMYLFNFAMGGTRDLHAFREEADAAMATVANGEGVSDNAKQPAGAREGRRRPRRR